MNEVAKIYQAALAIINQRGQNYGGIEMNFQRAANIATLKLNKYITPYDVAVIMESVKDARRAEDSAHVDSHIDGLNYKAFAMMFAPVEPPKEKSAPVAAPAKRKPGRPPKAKGDAPAPSAPPVKRGRGRPKKVK